MDNIPQLGDYLSITDKQALKDYYKAENIRILKLSRTVEVLKDDGWVNIGELEEVKKDIKRIKEAKLMIDAVKQRRREEK